MLHTEVPEVRQRYAIRTWRVEIKVDDDTVGQRVAAGGPDRRVRRRRRTGCKERRYGVAVLIRRRQIVDELHRRIDFRILCKYGSDSSCIEAAPITRAHGCIRDKLIETHT